MAKLLSLCIPTYGVSEWVFPVLDSIYNQNVDEELYEVVVTDNGNNKDFEEKIIDFSKKHSNLIYKKTTAYSFLNEIESYKAASGEFIKFINHRTILLQGSLQYFIEFVKDNIEKKPVVYFTTGMLKENKVTSLNSFDGFVKKLSYWSSWSTGMSFWKEEFEDIEKIETSEFNELFPHTNILFRQRKKNNYIVDDTVLLEEINIDDTKKGKYDLFYAFAVEYPSIILDLLRSNDISLETFNSVKIDNLFFISRLYFNYVKRKKKCSYDLSSFDKSITVFYSKKEVNKSVRKMILRKLMNRKSI